MEEKYPIRFSLSQFIVLLGVEVVVLALVFLLGARFGGSLLPGQQEKTFAMAPAYQALTPEAKAPSKLVDTADGNEAEAPPDAEVADVPVYQIGPNGENQGQENEAAPAEEKLAVNKSLFAGTADKNTMVRFKSSGNTKFAVETGQFFDEVLASHEINKLKQKGLEAYIVIIEGRGGTPTFGVRMGSFGDRNLAEQFAVKISNEQGLELRVVQVN